MIIWAGVAIKSVSTAVLAMMRPTPAIPTPAIVVTIHDRAVLLASHCQSDAGSLPNPIINTAPTVAEIAAMIGYPIVALMIGIPALSAHNGT
ncbi:hypothetical protein GCM10011614_23760 [Novosphingobium colocasiae]|uniref:Uncharacterized protein n=1 Tax=Novosphingobium colocasiae TaxID=1256513 RepID=A0A918PHB3_9SPHN|nr:hypothetical protein GCM10011614_23760 [Novosphingobium colocasiae]